MNKPGNITVILADAHPFVREGIACLLRPEPEFKVVGECSDGVAAVNLIVSMRPRIAIVELALPKLHGVEVIRKVCGSDCPSRIIVLSISRDRSMVENAFRNGARGYVLKEGPSRHLLDAIKCVLDGDQYLTPLLGQGRNDRRNQEPGNTLGSLSPREQAVFGFLVEGMRPKNIALLMGISPKTVDTYRSSIMHKLGVAGIAGLVKFAIHRNRSPTGVLHEQDSVRAANSGAAAHNNSTREHW